MTEITHPARANTPRARTGWLARYGLRRRLALTLCGISLSSCLVFGLCGYVTYQYTLTHILTWHMEPVMRMLVRSLEQGSPPEELHILARSLRVSWYTDSEIPDDLRPREENQKLTRVRGGLYVFVSRAPDGACYAVTGKITDLNEVEAALFHVALGCALVSLVAALLVSVHLSRRLVSPLVKLTTAICQGQPMADSELLDRADETGELARAFADRERSLKAFLEREQLFTGDVSHELRTPLTVLQGATEILESRVTDKSLQPVIERMAHTIDSMTVTVRTMLLLARVPDQLEQRTFDMSALARACEDRVRELLGDRDVSYTASLPDRLMLEGNPDLASLVLTNLLDNACRYTEKGCVELKLNQDGLTIKDTASPISSELQQHMFKRGVRGQSSKPGSGLGLALVQRGCERLGWGVAHTTWSDGNVFVVRFTNRA